MTWRPPLTLAHKILGGTSGQLRWDIVKFLTLGILMEGFKCLIAHKSGTPQGVTICDIHSCFFHEHLDKVVLRKKRMQFVIKFPLIRFYNEILVMDSVFL